MLKFDTLDSTNNYAMQIIDADKAEHGLTILADAQSAGKGQRGKSWSSPPGESLLMSLIIKPAATLREQTLFLTAIAVGVAEAVEQCLPDMPVKIKWPNDIIIGDKKAGGILIENVVRGLSWDWAVIGIGLNVSQKSFPDSLPFATSLKIGGAGDVVLERLAAGIKEGILEHLGAKENTLNAYNTRLYKKGLHQEFSKGDAIWNARVIEMNPKGELEVMRSDGTMEQYTHGTVEWVWKIQPEGQSAAEAQNAR